ncbi:MAG: hypothetical protein ACRCZJ_00220 [Erysipelotrichaceae bacterium]
MRDFFALIQRFQGKAIAKDKRLRKGYPSRKALAKTMQLDCATLLDWIYLDVVEHAIEQKTTLEQWYREQYCLMQDYWKGLEYQERARLMRIAIQAQLHELACFEHEGTNIYIPILDERMNRLYVEESALFELKQYQRLFTDFQAQCVHANAYGLKPLFHGFSSLEYQGETQLGEVFYHPLSTTIVILSSFEDAITIPLKQAPSETVFQGLRDAISSGQPDELFAQLQSERLLKRKTIRKLKRYLKKKK